MGIALLGLFALVMTAVTAVGYWFLRKQEAVVVVDPFAGNQSATASFATIFQWLGEKAGNKPERAESLTKRLSTAGFKREGAPHAFRGLQVASTVLMAIAAWMGALAGGSETPELAVICGAGMGYLGPDRVLNILVLRRRQRIRRGLTSALELMTLAVEAGQSLDVALLETARGLQRIHPDLALEFQQMLIELRAGANRADSFRSLAERTNEPEIKKFTGLLIDTDRYGTPLGPALRTHSKYIQQRFRQQAQEKARKIGVKLVFPVFFLIFPSVILVTLGPALIMVKTQMDKYMGM